MAQDIRIYIEKVVLDGFEGTNVKDLKKVIQEHLTALITEQGLPDGLSGQSYYGRLYGGQIEINTNPKTEGIGPGIAGGIYHGIKSIP